MAENKSAQDKIREQVNGWKAEKVEKTMAETKEVENSLVALKENREMMEMYQKNADVGSENISQGSLPALKVHSAGKSTKNILANGNKPTDGYFFYKPDQCEFKEIECHLLYVSKGYYAPDMNGKDKFNQIIAGVIVNGGDTRSFVMYVNGKRLSHLWEMGKELAVYTKAKPVGVPMFALRIKMSTYSEPNDYGESWLIKFDIMKNKDGSPILISDPGEFQFLRDHVDTIKSTLDRLVSSKAGEDTVTEENREDIPFPEEIN